MNFLYNYGISQEEALTEYKALELTEGDSLLCIASAGEIPLNIAAMADIKIIAADVSVNQIRLCKIKQSTALNCDPIKGASFLGYMNMHGSERERIFRDDISPYLSEDDRKFWQENHDAVREGVIKSGRFEKYMQKVTNIGRFIVGKKNLYSLFECNSIGELEQLFDKKPTGLVVN